MTKRKRNLQLSDEPVRLIVPLVAAPAVPANNTAFTETLQAMERLRVELTRDPISQRDVTLALGRVRGHLNFIRAHHKMNSAVASVVAGEVEIELARKYAPASLSDIQERQAAQRRQAADRTNARPSDELARYIEARRAAIRDSAPPDMAISSPRSTRASSARERLNQARAERREEADRRRQETLTSARARRAQRDQ